MRALVVLLLVLLSFDGLGRAFRRIACPSVQVPSGVVPALGFSLFLAACGPIELFHLAGRWTFGLLLAAGLACEGGSWARRLWQGSRPVERLTAAIRIGGMRGLVPWAAVAIALVLLFLRWSYASYNIWDDYQGYLIFPQRLLQQGWLGDDLFDLRRVEMGLGGASYLSALFLTLSDVSQLRAVDAGVGSAILFWLLLDHIRLNGLTVWRASLLLCAFFFFTALAPLINTSSHLTAGALLYAFLVCARSWNLRAPPGGAVPMSLLLAGMAILKAQYLIPAVVFPLSVLGVRLYRDRSLAALGEALRTAAVALAVLLPWMLASYGSIGTPFFPFLGVSTSQSGAFGHFESGGKIALNIAHNLSYGIAALAAALVVRRTSTDVRRGDLVLIVAANILLYIVVFNFVLSAFAFRYLYSFAVLPMLFILCEFLGSVTPAGARSLMRSPVAAAIALAFGVFLVQMATGRDSDTADTADTASLPENLGDRLRNPTPTGNDVVLGSPLFLRSETFRLRAEAIRRLQAAIPAGAPFVAVLDFPFILDFARQPISIMDFPGGAGPGKGVPYEGSAEDLAVYLRAQKRRYLAFAFFNQAFHPAYFVAMLGEGSFVMRNLASRTVAVQAQIAELRRKYPVLYDDGESFALDLGA
jgi:hypothetical protein